MSCLITTTALIFFFFFNDTATTEIYTLSLHDALPISSEVVRPGAPKTVIEGAFELISPALDRLRPPLTALGVEVDDGRLVLKREIGGEGRSRAWVNGSPATVSMLAQLGALLVDLHGQHETQSLLRPDAQRDILDAYADAAVERVAVRDAHERLKELEQRDAELKARREEVQRSEEHTSE